MPRDAASTVGILHYTCPPIVGGVELIMAQHARLPDPEAETIALLEQRIHVLEERLIRLERTGVEGAGRGSTG